MKVILLQDVAKIGRKHEIVAVPDGYAQNQLIPKGAAAPATPENLKAVERLKAGREAENRQTEERFFKAKEALKDRTIAIRGLKSDNGHLFAALRPEMIAAAAKADGFDLDPALILLPSAIKTTGTHEVGLQHGSHRAAFVINIE